MGSGRERWDWRLKRGWQVEGGRGDGGRGRGSHDGPEPHGWERPQVTRGLTAREYVSVVLNLPSRGIWLIITISGLFIFYTGLIGLEIPAT